jgi:hypothetical protein
MLAAIILTISFAGVIAWLWAGGIDYIKKNESNYKADDFLNWDKDINKTAGRDGWDDNLVHTEGEI